MSDSDGCCGPKALTHTTPAYRRALWTVVLLNLGYGGVEMVGGFLAASQALKADALDFIGDGSITLLGLLAISWGATWRARAAFLQGMFLAALGIVVLVTTAHRMIAFQMPEAELMGTFAGIALVVNIVSAIVLMQHKTGDANVRAVWLFSRNDAIGNVAVLVAASFVWLTATPWPDLIVATGIAALFLHSAFEILRESLRELRTDRLSTG